MDISNLRPGDTVNVEARVKWLADKGLVRVEPIDPSWGEGFYAAPDHITRITYNFRPGDRVMPTGPVCDGAPRPGKALAVGDGWVLIDFEDGEMPEVHCISDVDRDDGYVTPTPPAVEEAA